MDDLSFAIRDDDPDPEDDPGMPIQLGLFSPDNQEVDAAFAALGRLELDRAELLFRAALDREPEHADSLEGAAAVAHWRSVFARLEPLAAGERALALWQAVASCPAEFISRTMRRRLLEKILDALEKHGELVPFQELCAGDVLLALGRLQACRAWLEGALRREPSAARLSLLLGDICWLTEDARSARAAYSRALLLDPTLAAWSSVCWPELRRRVDAVGGPRAALELWAEGGLPLPPVTSIGPPHPAIAEVWAAMAGASDAAMRQQYELSVRQREQLRDLAPDIFARYMDRLEGSPPTHASPTARHRR